MSPMLGEDKDVDVELNYFICTLGHAAELKSADDSGYQTVTEFIDFQAGRCPEKPAVGFPVPSHDGAWGFQLYTFADLRKNSLAVLGYLSPTLGELLPSDGDHAVALLSSSSLDFLFTWLALMRAGLSVLLIAPQCTPAAIAHLCRSCRCSILFHDEEYAHLAGSTEAEMLQDSSIKVRPLQALRQRIGTTPGKTASGPSTDAFRKPSKYDVAYWHHTSGTSGGQPKPIPQSHNGAVCCLPQLDGSRAATFTTTPLYHGGIADCFRAWTSQALIWLFPGGDVPITSNNIASCLKAAAQAQGGNLEVPPVKYFSSVPYVLQMLTEDPEGLRHLQSMDLVGVGGAALPPVIGEQLVTKGIKLVSRFGSAECGFLLSSHRTYATDKDWQYLRVPLGSRFISFEDQNDNSGLHELVVLKGWPHMAKTNRPGGSFATHDLFEPHPTIENAWRYHSRSDSQITLVSGKKFDPAPLEDAISSASPLIRDVLIIGNGAQVPGALIFRSSQGQAMENETLVHEIWKVLHSENGKSQSHSQVPRHMMLVLKDTQPLPKSSKGTILRGVAEKQYASEIASLYATEQLPEQSQKLPNNMDDIRTTVKYVVKEVVDADISINDDEDFYRAGVDSMKCARIRSLLQRRLPKNTVLPLNVVYDTGSINALSNYVLCLRDGNTIERTDRGQEMLDLVNRYSNFDEGGDKPRSAQDSNTALYSSGPGGHVVLLTGSTGALGAHILDNLRHHKSVFQILCLVRAKNQSIAHERVSKSLVGRGKPPLDGAEDSRVLCIPADLSKPDFGTSSDLKQVTHIIHAAWAVNFSLPLKSFVQDHIQGLHNLIRLAISSPRGAKVISCSSTASVLGPSHPHLIPERISTDPSDSDALGYSQSKWVAEAICARAARLPGMTGRIKVLRIGQLTGDTEKGIWNMSEAWPLMLSTVGVLGCLPRLDEPLSWLPLDVAAKGLLDIAFCQETGAVDVQDECPVYHVLNNDASATWNDLLQWVARAREKPFGIVEPAVWLDRLEQVDSHPAKGLLNLWRSAYTSEKSTAPRDKKESTCFTTDGAARVSPSLKEIPAIDEGFIRKVWGWLEKETKNG